MTRPGLIRMLLRGAFRHCAWCGGRGGFFTGWFKKAECCQTCGLRWRRDDVGFELGAAAMTAIICFSPLMLVLAGMVAITWPEVAIVPMFIVLGVLAVVLPLLLYGSAYMMWQAIDIVMRPPTPDDFESLDVDDVDDVADVAAASETPATD